MNKKLIFILSLISISGSMLPYTRPIQNATPYQVGVILRYAAVGPCQDIARTIEPGKSEIIEDPAGRIGSSYPCSLTKIEATVLDGKNNGQGTQAEPYNGPHNASETFIIGGTQNGPFIVTRDAH